MLDSLAWQIGTLIVIMFFIKKFIKSRVSLQDKLISSKNKVAQALEKTQEEHHNLRPEAALQPVRAGLLEITALIPNPPLLIITPRELGLTAPEYNLKITWQQRQTTLSSRQKNRQIKGRGHWIVRLSRSKATELSEFTEESHKIAKVLPEINEASQELTKVSQSITEKQSESTEESHEFTDLSMLMQYLQKIITNRGSVFAQPV